MTTINNYDTWLALMQSVNVQQNGQIPPSVFNSWYNECNEWLFKELVKEFQTSQVLSDLLSPFITYTNVRVLDQRGQNFGLAAYPSDYEYFCGATILRPKEENTCFYNKELPIIDGDGKSKKFTDPDFAQMIVHFAGAEVGETPVKMIDTARWPACLMHKTKGPNWDNPKITQFSSGFKVSPKGITSVVLAYFHTPRKSVFGYTISADDIAIYNPGTSVQLEWSVQALPKFIPFLQEKYAAYIGDTNTFSMSAEQAKNRS